MVQQWEIMHSHVVRGHSKPIAFFAVLVDVAVDVALADRLKFRERKRDSSSLVYVLHKTCN